MNRKVLAGVVFPLFMVVALSSGCCDDDSGTCPGGDAGVNGGDGGGQDPCEGVDCSGHGTCHVQDGQAVCDCEDGFLAQGLSCVADSEVASFFAVPRYTTLSPQGGYVAYIAMTPVPDTKQARFRSGDFILRNAATNQETVLEADVQVMESIGGNFFPVRVFFGRQEGKMVVLEHREPTGTSSPGYVVDLATGDRQPMGDLGAWETVAMVYPDEGWALVTKQTYQGRGAAVKWMDPLTESPQLITETCRDLHVNVDVDAIEVDQTGRIVVGWCERSGNTTSWHLRAYEYPSAGDPVPLCQGQPRKVFARPNGVVYMLDGADHPTFVTWTADSARDLGSGNVDTVSPDGRWVGVIRDVGGTMSYVLVSTDGSAPERVLGEGVDGVWTQDDSFYFHAPDASGTGHLYLSVDGGEPQDLGVEAEEIHPLADGYVWGLKARATGGGYGFAVLDDDDTTFYQDVPSMTEAWVLRESGPVSLGWGTFWQVSPTNVLRGDFYYDILHGALPDPDNGYYLYQP